MQIGNSKANSGPLPGIVGMPQEQHYFIKEQAFTQSQRYTFDTNEVKWFFINPANYVPGDTQEFGKVIAEVPSFFAAAGPLEVDFYESPTIGAATPTLLTMPSFNRVSGSAILAQTELSTLNQAPDALGSKYSEILIPSTAAGVGQRVGFSVAENLPFLLDLSKTILMTVKNLDGAATLVGIRWSWFEV